MENVILGQEGSVKHFAYEIFEGPVGNSLSWVSPGRYNNSFFFYILSTLRMTMEVLFGFPLSCFFFAILFFPFLLADHN